MQNLFQHTHPEWQPILGEGLAAMDQNYLKHLETMSEWYPGPENIFAAFRQPITAINYVLLGESPYPRQQSANGYAFWDAKVKDLWSQSGLSKEVNRATSLRNFIKMLLVASGALSDDVSQEAIVHLDKNLYIQTATQLFEGMLRKGFMLLNACLVYRENEVPYHAKHWKPFMDVIFERLSRVKPEIQCILFGKIAREVPQTQLFNGITAEHPYNISFIRNPVVLNFFKPLELLCPYDSDNY